MVVEVVLVVVGGGVEQGVVVIHTSLITKSVVRRYENMFFVSFCLYFVFYLFFAFLLPYYETMYVYLA